MVRSLESLSSKKERQRSILGRKSVLMKKAHELSVLCDVKVGLIIFSPEEEEDSDDKSKPLIWPENPQEIQSLIESYKKTGESISSDSSKVLNQQIQKAKNDLAKLKHKNAESKRLSWDDQLGSISSQELLHFGGELEKKIQEIRYRARVIKESMACVLNQNQNQNQNQIQSLVSAMDASNQNMFDESSVISQSNPLFMNPPLQQHCTPMLSDYALAMQKFQPQVVSSVGS